MDFSLPLWLSEPRETLSTKTSLFWSAFFWLVSFFLLAWVWSIQSQAVGDQNYSAWEKLAVFSVILLALTTTLFSLTSNFQVPWKRNVAAILSKKREFHLLWAFALITAWSLSSSTSFGLVVSLVMFVSAFLYAGLDGSRKTRIIRAILGLIVLLVGWSGIRTYEVLREVSLDSIEIGQASYNLQPGLLLGSFLALNWIFLKTLNRVKS